MADIAQIDQVIINISTNTRGAMLKGGTLTIETKLLNPDTECIDAQVIEAPGGYAFLSISDTGAGMSDSIKEKIFDPIFRRKRSGKAPVSAFP
jgi:two-component system, cell cycle sensor histidine kinase and response regulator CckA